MTSIPALDFTSLIVAVFTYVNQLLPTFGPVAAIGIAFGLVFGLVTWLGGQLKGMFGASRR